MQGVEDGAMRGYTAGPGHAMAQNGGGDGGSLGCGQPGRLEPLPAFGEGPPRLPPLGGGHPKRSRSKRSVRARVSPPSQESYGGPLMLPLQDLHQVLALLMLCKIAPMLSSSRSCSSNGRRSLKQWKNRQYLL